MKSDLDAAIERIYAGEGSVIMRQHKEFALSNRERGAQTLDEIEETSGLSLEGARLLDVGCAYAGFVIEAAARGADAWGVEISQKLFHLAQLNAEGESGAIHVVPGDFLTDEVIEALPDDFDLVLLNDVFEHIYDTATLVSRAGQVTAPGASIVFAIPNGSSLRFVEREGHYGVPGISLLPANWWHAVVPHFTAFYRPWRHYAALFHAYGFSEIAVWDRMPNLSLASAREQVSDGLARAVAAAGTLEYRDERARPVMERALALYREAVADDLERGDVRLLAWRYLTDFWRGTAVKTESAGEQLEVPGAWIRRRRKRPSPELGVVYEPVPLSFSARQLRSHWIQRTQTAVTTTEVGALRCDVVGGEDRRKSQYGGLCLPVRIPHGLRIELELVGPENIEAVYVDGYNLWRSRVLRWLWRTSPPNEAAGAGAHWFSLVAGRRCGPFAAISPSLPGLARSVHIYIRVRPGTRAGFVIHGLEVGSAAIAASIRSTSSA